MADWARGNWHSGSELLTDDAVVSWQEPPADLVVGRGPDDIARKLRLFLEQWQEFRVEPRAVTPVGDDAVLVLAHQFHVGKVSGAPSERDTWIVWRFDGDRVAQIRWNWDRATAFDNAGLPDPGD